ncbi:MAG: 50S ribosomal protein L32 [Armatimonadetes bacterium]|nr:50S ribosomal protein L32 [Armatimonadota bacterium]
MPNPKYKTPKSKTRRRRSHLALSAPNTVPCPQCHEPRLPHHVCLNCGTYNGRTVIEVEKTKG